MLHSGDILPQDCLESGSSWLAQALGRKDEVLEEAELVIYCAREVATLYVNTESGDWTRLIQTSLSGSSAVILSAKRMAAGMFQEGVRFTAAETAAGKKTRNNTASTLLQNDPSSE
ncbi:MAG: hypothetical protein Q4F43_10145 [Eubacteriales bacterium]|nr:hypothetical protein [Eubacteriales bacterium]